MTRDGEWEGANYLYMATKYNKPEMVKFLLENKADVSSEVSVTILDSYIINLNLETTF